MDEHQPAAPVVGPLLVGNTLSWALWGFLTAYFVAYLQNERHDRARGRAWGQTRAVGPSATSSAINPSRDASRIFGLRSRGKRKTAVLGAGSGTGNGSDIRRAKAKAAWDDDAFAQTDVNPWTIAFTPRTSDHALSVSAYPKTSPPPPVRGRLARALAHVHGHTNTGSGAHTQSSSDVSSPYTYSTPQHPSPLSPSLPAHHRVVSHAYPPLPLESPHKEHEDTAEAVYDASEKELRGPSLFLILFLYALVCAQAILGTSQFWHAVVPTSGQDRNMTEWTVVVAADCVAPISFLATMLYFAYGFFVTSCPIARVLFQRKSSSNTASSSRLPPSAAESNGRNMNVDANDTSNTKTSLSKDIEAGTSVVSDKTGRPKLRPLRLSMLAESARLGDHDGMRSGSIGATGMSASFPCGDARYLGNHWRAALALFVIAAAIVAVCGLIDSSRLFRSRAPLGAPPRTDGIALTWLAGSFALDAVLCGTLTLELAAAGAFTFSSDDGSLENFNIWSGLARWANGVILLLGPGGGILFLDALLALVFALVWGSGEKFSTIPLIPLVIMPALYAGTVVLYRAYVASLPTSAYCRSQRGSSKKLNDGGMDFSSSQIGDRKLQKLDNDDAYAQTIELDLHAAALSGEGTNSTTSNAPIHEREVPRAIAHLKRSSGAEGGKVITGAELANLVGTGTGNFGAKTPRKSVQSEGAVSLDLPVFRPGRARACHAYAPFGPSGGGSGYSSWDDELDNDDGSDFSESELGMDDAFSHALGAGGTGLEGQELVFGSQGRQAGMWGYGFAGAMNPGAGYVQAQKGFGTGSNAGTYTGSGPTNLNASSSGTNAEAGPSRRWKSPDVRDKRSTVALDDEDMLAFADEDDDRVSMLSGASRARSRSHSRRRRHRAAAVRALTKRRMTMPAAPSTTSSISEFYTGNGGPTSVGPGSPAGSVLVIGRSGRRGSDFGYGYGYDYGEGSTPPTREPSIAAKASVAATRASTGSAWSHWSVPVRYPRPLMLPDLDTDLGLGAYTSDGTGAVLGLVPGTGVGTATNPGEGTNASTGTNVSQATSSGTWHTAQLPNDEPALPDSVLAGIDGEEPRRRGREHPLKRLVEMGRLGR